jgi:hypothetical protein
MMMVQVRRIGERMGPHTHTHCSRPSAHLRTKVSIQEELTSGTKRSARAEALMMKSFTDSFTPSASNSFFNLGGGRGGEERA